MEMIRKRNENVKTEELDSYRSDFLGKLLKAYHSKDETKKICLDDLIDECKAFYIAGHETTTNLLSWTILLLATHTDWQDRARKEVLELSCQQIPSPDSISRLKTMSMIINESLRLFSPTAVSRKTNKEVKLGKLLVPANMEIYIPILAVHHDPEIWGEDVHFFKPERFAEGVAKATNNNMSAYIPFGLGPRTCVGMNFATTQAEVALSMLLQSYKFTLSPTYVHSPVRALTICPQYGVRVMLQAVSEP